MRKRKTVRFVLFLHTLSSSFKTVSVLRSCHTFRFFFSIFFRKKGYNKDIHSFQKKETLVKSQVNFGACSSHIFFLTTQLSSVSHLGKKG